MIFLIEENIVNAKDSDFLECFEKLLLGYIEGNHLLYIKPVVVDLIENIYFNKMDDRMKRQFIHYQLKSMIESKLAFNLVNYAIKIVPKDIDEKKVKLGNHDIAYLHADKFLTSATVQKTILLGENTDDSKIYKIFAEKYIRTYNATLKVNVKVENGGGSTTAPVFKDKIEEKEELCLCLLDSDKKYPSDVSLGETAKRVKRMTQHILTGKTHYYIEERCRELENMLPEGFYYKKYFADVNKKDIFSKFELLNRVDEKLVFYFDIKKGLKHFDIRKYNDWSRLSSSELRFETIPLCCEDNFCAKKEICTCIVIKNFGIKVLEHFIEFYRNIDNFDFDLIFNSSSDFLKEIWTHIGKLVFSWGIGQEKSIANI